jgi:hypothetical protein
MSSGPSLHSIKRAHDADLGISLQSGGRTLWRRNDSGSATKNILLAETSRVCQKVYEVLHHMRYCQTDH